MEAWFDWYFYLVGPFLLFPTGHSIIDFEGTYYFSEDEVDSSSSFAFSSIDGCTSKLLASVSAVLLRQVFFHGRHPFFYI